MEQSNKRRKKNQKPHHWTEEEQKYLKEIFPGRSRIESARMFNEHFGLDLTEKSICTRAKLIGAKCGIDARFQKGHTPTNKGRKQREYMSTQAIERTSATRFKKGQIPHNHEQVGTEKVDRDGYILVKVSDKKNVRKNENWMLKHRYIWEQAHKQKVPDGHAVIFLDQNKRNFDIDNLMLVSRNELLRINHYKKFTDNKEVNKAQVLTTRLESAIKKKKKKNEEL